MITLSKERYEELLESELYKLAMEGSGVDNWSGYDYFKDFYNELKEDSELPGVPVRMVDYEYGC